MGSIWLIALAVIGDPWGISRATVSARHQVLPRAEALLANLAPEVRREGIRQVQWFGLAEAYPQLVREALGDDPTLRKEALVAIRSIKDRCEDRRLLVEPDEEAQGARGEEVDKLYEESGAKEIYELFDHAEVALSMHHAPAEARMAYMHGLMTDLFEDSEYEPEDIPGGCGFGVGGGPEAPLRFLAVRHRKEFVALAKTHLSDAKANNRGGLIDLIREMKLEAPLESAIRPLVDDPRTGIRVPALAAVARRLTIEELKKRMGDPSGAVRITAYWELERRDKELAIRNAIPRIASMVKDERFQVMATLFRDETVGRKWLVTLSRHADKAVAAEALEFLRAMDEDATNHPPQNAN